jgi:hypothetical protein
MALLAELGLTNLGGLLLIAAPDSVLAEAGRSTPRPSFVSSLRTAHPALRICWWPEREMLTAEALSRLHWLVSTASGEAWLLSDPADDEPLTTMEVREALAGTKLSVGDERALADGSTAVKCVATGDGLAEPRL